MHYLLDALVVVILLIYTVSCAKKGFVECLFGLLSTIVSFALAYMFSNTVLEMTDGLFGIANEIGLMAASTLSWLLIFLVVKFVIRIIKKIVTAVLDKIPLVGSLNHLLGLVLGIAQGLLIVWTFLAVISFLSTSSPELIIKILQPMEDTILAKELYQNNPIAELLYKLTYQYGIG
jgi:uncharacterized membrane protein required for colicin V production